MRRNICNFRGGYPNVYWAIKEVLKYWRVVWMLDEKLNCVMIKIFGDDIPPEFCLHSFKFIFISFGFVKQF